MSISHVQASTAPTRTASAPGASVTQYLAIPAAAFHPNQQNFEFVNEGYSLRGYYPTDWYADFYAAVHLPQASTVQKVKFIYYDDSSNNCHLSFFRTATASGTTFSIEPLASLSSSGTPGFGFDSTIDGRTTVIDNNGKDYYLEFKTYGASGSVNQLYFVLFEYTLPDPPQVYDYLNIAPGAFIPFSENHMYENEGWRFVNLNKSPSVHIEAPVFLPDGAEVDQGRFAYYDISSWQNPSAHLHRTDLAGSFDPALAMVDLSASGEPVFDYVTGPIVRYQNIQNGTNAYWVYYDLPVAGTSGYLSFGRGFQIRFKPPAFTPTRNISVPAAAFTPISAYQDFENHGRYLKNTGARDHYVAPIYLPNGWYIRRVKFYYERLGTPESEATALLRAWSVGTTHVVSDIATLTSSGTGWTHTSSDLLNSQIDLQYVVYWLEWRLPTDYTASDHVLPSGMVVEVWDGTNLDYLPIMIK